MRKATFAGGCFWCMVKPFDQFDGVESVVAGYTGGNVPNPEYKTVCGGETGHVEAVQITFDPKKISYEQLLNLYWRQIDPTDDGGQFVDRGTSYRTAIFYHDNEQKRLAESSRDALENEKRFLKPIVTKILPMTEFYKAEPEHYERETTSNNTLKPKQSRKIKKIPPSRREYRSRIVPNSLNLSEFNATRAQYPPISPRSGRRTCTYC